MTPIASSRGTPVANLIVSPVDNHLNLSVTGAEPLGHSTCGHAELSHCVRACICSKLWGTKKRTIRVNTKNNENSDVTSETSLHNLRTEQLRCFKG